MLLYLRRQTGVDIGKSRFRRLSRGITVTDCYLLSSLY